MKDLHHQPFRTLEVQRTSTVSVGARRRQEALAHLLEVARPAVHVLCAWHQDADVVEQAGRRRHLGPMQRDVVSSTVKIDVVGPGPPLDAVSQDVYEEALGAFEIGEAQRHVA